MPERRPRFLSENLFSVTQFPTRTLTVSGTTLGFDGYRATTGRRVFRDRWETAATPAWIQASHSVPRAADMIALDRGHNLGGREVVLERSSGAGWTPVLTFTPPVSPSPIGTTLAAGATTGEGAYVRTFEAASDPFWRLRVESGGSVRIVGIWVGRSWQPSFFLEQPTSDYSGDTFLDENASSAGWRGGTLATFIRAGELRIRLSSFEEFDTPEGPKNTFIRHYQRSRPAWMVLDQARAEEAFLATIPAGSRVAWALREGGWTYRSANIPFAEHEPVPYR